MKIAITLVKLGFWAHAAATSGSLSELAAVFVRSLQRRQLHIWTRAPLNNVDIAALFVGSSGGQVGTTAAPPTAWARILS